MPFKALPSPALQRAFTLIEMLVVMIIMAMVVTLVVQGFGYSLGLYQRVVNAQNSSYKQVFAYQWLKSSLGSQVAMRPSDRSLEGNQQQLSTYSYQPIWSQEGIKTLIQWELTQTQTQLQLVYRQADEQFMVYEWPDARGQFEYLDDQGKWVDHWPTKKLDLQPLPKAIRLVVTNGRETFNYVIPNKTRRRAEVTSDEVLYGRD